MNLRISELPELSSLSDDDYIVLQRKSGSTKTSYKLKFSSLKAQFQDKFKDLGIGTAAMCNAMQFAPFAHGHDYSDIWYFPSYGPDSHNAVLSNRDPLCCTYDGEFKIVKYEPGIDQKTEYTISAYQPPVTQEIRNEAYAYVNHGYMHKIGDIQMLAVEDLNIYLTAYRGYTLTDNNIDIHADGFDGFVIPNGQTFTCTASTFKGACKLYAGNANATRFTVPNLANTFFKCDPGLPTSQMTPLSQHASTVVLPEHNHNGSVTASNSTCTYSLNNVQFQVQGSDTNGPQYSNCIHAGNGTARTSNAASPADYHQDSAGRDVYPKIERFNLVCTIESMTCNQAGNGGEAYPDHINIPALLYIGKPDE